MAGFVPVDLKAVASRAISLGAHTSAAHTSAASHSSALFALPTNKNAAKNVKNGSGHVASSKRCSSVDDKSEGRKKGKSSATATSSATASQNTPVLTYRQAQFGMYSR